MKGNGLLLRSKMKVGPLKQINITIQIDSITKTYSIAQNVKPGRSVIQEMVQILDGTSPDVNESIPVEFRVLSSDGSIFNVYHNCINHFYYLRISIPFPLGLI